MVNRRFTQVATSDEDEDEAPPPPQQHSKLRKRKRMKLLDEEEEDNDNSDNDEEKEEEKKDPPQTPDDAKPIGDPLRVSGKGRGRKRHYESFEFDGNQYYLEDPVLLVPEDKEQKPYVAIVKDIIQYFSGSIMVAGQWFYRPEEAEKKGGGSWKSCDTRELFYSFHRDEVPAESVMHKCVVHFVPLNKQFPKRKQHPGFIVQKVYDTLERKLWKLTDKDFEDVKQQEIDELVQKTQKRIGELLDIEPEESPPVDQEEVMKNKRSLRRKSISPIDVSREEEGIPKSDQHSKPETPMSCVNNNSEHHRILVNFNALTGNVHRDKWLERLLQHIQYMCNYDEGVEKGKGSGNADSDEIKIKNNDKTSEIANDCQDKGQKSSESFVWPDAAVSAIVALEKASNEALPTDFQKYNQKLRQLDFNLKNNALLARRLLNGELEPSKILNMTPIELKEGLTAEELTKKEPDEKQHMQQMTDARCSRCMEFKVGLREIIHAGHDDRYQLECSACGNSWYASRDEVSTLTIDASDSKRSTGTAPSATAKFEDVQKKLASPRESENTADDISKKTGEPHVPVLDTQKSFGKSRKDDNIEGKKHVDKE
ncbi:unnamed protein product [Lathyrus oleraceus]|uniref:uncharacterized protein LOC127120737 isoform X1 n=1 Tax=Pisum sativum TaxID=3888 RepID=UPI0021D20449|nr:uncharacterized protein LOC127120737 isoform X1 [Pisum sativum]